MKKIFYSLAIFSLLFTACENPMEDIYEEIDANPSAIVGDVTYTVTDEDYEEFGLTYGSFNSEDEAKEIFPGFLTEKYPVWGKGSSALIEYKLYIGNAPGISDYTYADEYSLAVTDYPGSLENAVAFYQDENSADYIPATLEDNFTTAEEGDVVLAKYSQYVGETENGITEFHSADFAGAGTLLDYEAISVSGDQTWYGTNYGAKVTGYDGGTFENEDWLISPDIDLSSFPNATFQTTQIFNYGDPSGFSVLISTDYTDDVTTATWDVIELTNVPDGTSWDEFLSEEYSLAAYNGETINIAFKYISTVDDAGTYEIVDVSLKASGVEGETMDVAEFYTFDGSAWELSEDVYYLSDADFDSMGEGDDQPGEYNNFGSSISPDDYLPTFLSIKYPYAQEGDALDVIYKYYSSSSGAQLRGNLYTFTSGVWTGYESTIETTLQLGHDGTTWVPDNTIKYELTGADYTLIADTYRDVAGYSGAVGNLENYGNISTFNWDEDQIDAAINTVIEARYPGLEEGQKFAITIYVYDGSSHNITINYIKEEGVYVRNE
ncbi:choice-of-anchor J domain-containing protein [Polaribacter sargassicola]|uniref:choice-of-anchor J domain-containing protein n=1 Tax=Polaribacter sargassicola TaxID=2836891 RepID=UPI001F2E29E6|nr:choice-of-anchor J domain-containing protein [Polaribacter sp. DS7-9]MCG1035246.1 choice-of-anchor J domain-containing protein [Polaribacter sp. DS7-9]